MFKNKKLLISLLLGLSWASAQGVSFQTDGDQAAWKVVSSPLKCSLIHTVLAYGELEFLKEAGAGLNLVLHLNSPYKPQEGSIELGLFVPHWRLDLLGQAGVQASTVSSFMNYDPGNQWLQISEQAAWGFLGALELGVELVFRQVQHSGEKRELARVSGFYFQPAYKRFLACMDQLADLPYEAVYRSVVFFENASARLTDQNERWLMNVAAHAKQPAVWKVDLEGHTDRIGSYEANMQLSMLRVEAVKDFLISLGVPKEKISVRAVGEARTLSFKTDAFHRAKERHVRIKLHR